MQFRWLQRNDSDRVIVCFGGWAIGTSALVQLNSQRDVLYVDDFRTLSELPDLSAYHHKTLFAFSFGVAAAAHWLQSFADPFDQKVAMNGSASPVDRRLGIPPAIFTRTKEGLSAETFQSFLSLCHGTLQPEMQIDVDARQAELAAVEMRGAAAAPDFDRIWISTEDRIFPATNLRRAFDAQSAHVREIKAPHVPFASFETWEQLIQ